MLALATVIEAGCTAVTHPRDDEMDPENLRAVSVIGTLGEVNAAWFSIISIATDGILGA